MFLSLATFCTNNSITKLTIIIKLKWSAGLVKDVVRILKHSKSLKHLRLSYFMIPDDTDQLKVIVTALKGNCTLQTLKLYCDLPMEEDLEVFWQQWDARAELHDGFDIPDSPSSLHPWS